MTYNTSTLLFSNNGGLCLPSSEKGADGLRIGRRRAVATSEGTKTSIRKDSEDIAWLPMLTLIRDI